MKNKCRWWLRICGLNASQTELLFTALVMSSMLLVKLSSLTVFCGNPSFRVYGTEGLHRTQHHLLQPRPAKWY